MESNGIEFSEIHYEKITKGVWRASFSMTKNGLKIDTDLYAKTEERIKFKVEHLKKTGIILRD